MAENDTGLPAWAGISTRQPVNKLLILEVSLYTKETLFNLSHPPDCCQGSD